MSTVHYIVIERPIDYTQFPFYLYRIGLNYRNGDILLLQDCHEFESFVLSERRDMQIVNLLVNGQQHNIDFEKIPCLQKERCKLLKIFLTENSFSLPFSKEVYCYAANNDIDLMEYR